MLERDATKPLTGRVEIDDAYLGGERSGGKRGRGAPGKTPFVAAAETTPEGKPVRLKLGPVASFCSASISSFAKRSLDPGLTLRVWPACTVVSDGLQCFGGVTDAGCVHQAIKTGSGPAAARTPAFKWVNTALGNIKAAITGTYVRSTASTCRATWPSSNAASIVVTIWPRWSRACAGPACAPHPCLTSS